MTLGAPLNRRSVTVAHWPAPTQLPVGPFHGAHGGERAEDVIDTSIVSGWLPVVVVVIAVVFAVPPRAGQPRPSRRLFVAAGVVAASAAARGPVAVGRRARLSPRAQCGGRRRRCGCSSWPSPPGRAVGCAPPGGLGGGRRAVDHRVPGLAQRGLRHLPHARPAPAPEPGATTCCRVSWPPLSSTLSRVGKLPSKGTVVVERIPPTVSGFRAKDAYIYLPPAWFGHAAARAARRSFCCPGSPAARRTGRWRATPTPPRTPSQPTHEGWAPIIVMPDPNGFLTEDTECVNSKFGNAETYLTVDVPAFARSEFGAATGADSLAIAGLSAGATCSTVLALRHPDEFDTFASFSGFAAPTYLDYGIPKTIDDPLRRLAAALRRTRPVGAPASAPLSRVWAAGSRSGESDAVPHHAQSRCSCRRRGRRASTRARLCGRAGHDFTLWSQAFADALPWLAWRLHLMADQPHVPATCTAGAS